MEFRTFEDKASAINIDTGVNEQLAKMIQKHIEPDQKLAVGSLKYKKIIEQHLVSVSSLVSLCL
jgi:nucleolar protein 58